MNEPTYNFRIYRSASQTITKMLLAVMRIVMTVMMEVTGMLLTNMIMLLT